jgi:hypothetical protein
VLAGIVFLAIEIRQNNSLLASQASNAHFGVERERRDAGFVEFMEKNVIKR